MAHSMKNDDFEKLYADHAQPLFGFLVYRTGDRALAEDLLADSFERAMRARKRYDPGKASHKTWLYSIALNALRDHARRAQVEARAVERVGTGGLGAGDDAGLELVEHRDELSRALADLSREERE